MSTDTVTMPFIWLILLINVLVLMVFFVGFLFFRLAARNRKILQLALSKKSAVAELNNIIQGLQQKNQDLTESKKLFLAMRTKCENLIKENDILYSTVLRSLNTNVSPKTVEVMKYYHHNVEAILEFLQADNITDLVTKANVGASTGLAQSIAELQGMNQLLFESNSEQANSTQAQQQKVEFTEQFEEKMKGLELSLRDSEMCVKTLEDQLDLDHHKLTEAEQNNQRLQEKLEKLMHDKADVDQALHEAQLTLSQQQTQISTDVADEHTQDVVNKVHDEISILEQEKINMEKQLHEISASKSELQSQLEQLLDTNSKLESELTSLRQSPPVLKDEAAVKPDKVEPNLDHANQSELSQSDNSLKHENARLQQELKRLLHQNSELESQLTQVQENMKALQQTNQAKQAGPENIGTTELSSDSITDKKVISEQGNNKTIEKVTELERELGRSNGLIDILQAEKSEHLELIDNMKKERTQAQDKISLLEQEKQALLEQLGGLENNQSKAV